MKSLLSSDNLHEIIRNNVFEWQPHQMMINLLCVIVVCALPISISTQYFILTLPPALVLLDQWSSLEYTQG